MSKSLYLTSHRAHVNFASGGAHSTFLLFSIDDKKRIAWYSFGEANSEYAAEMWTDMQAGKKGSFLVFGQSTKSSPFQPLSDRKVDQFVESDGFVKARISVKSAKNRISIDLKVILKSGAEFLDLQFSSKESADWVGTYEKGIVQLLKVEKYSGGAISSPSRVLLPGRFNTKKIDDPIIITDDGGTSKLH